ncbi:hypothetical protein [Methylosinus sp. C49]|uniref:hypothetical protein n=1 Tax=Methylosinus sp. C49 TaxID=2699395 RepID=UPI0013A531D8|nr:hypothetical protein [Methylosinus sp. C49]
MIGVRSNVEKPGAAGPAGRDDNFRVSASAGRNSRNSLHVSAPPIRAHRRNIHHRKGVVSSNIEADFCAFLASAAKFVRRLQKPGNMLKYPASKNRRIFSLRPRELRTNSICIVLMQIELVRF